MSAPHQAVVMPSADAADILQGVRYAAVFNKHGIARPDVGRAKHCRQMLDRMAAAFGSRRDLGNVSPLDPESRARRARADRIAAVIGQACTGCALIQRGVCEGFRP